MPRNVRMPSRIQYTYRTASAVFELEMVEHPGNIIWASLSVGAIIAEMETVVRPIFLGERFEIESSSWTERAAIVIAYLCARPGDKTLPKDYFKSYTNAQLAFCAKHAKPLARVALQGLGEL